MIREFMYGLCMALADSVPGVSGGTIAFILGFYDKFIGSINGFVYGKGQDRKEAACYLGKLGLGWAVGMAAAVLVLSRSFEANIYLISSLFIGFIIAAIPLIIHEEMETVKQRYGNILFSMAGFLLVAAITRLNGIGERKGMDLSSLGISLALYLFFAGMAAISAMFLPGISGSTLLLIFGLYLPVISGIKDVLHFNFQALPALCIFGAGVIAGALTVVKVIKKCLERFRPQTIYTVLGLMAGSVLAIIEGPAALETPKEALSFESFRFWAFAAGILIISAFHWIGIRKGKARD